VLRDLTSRFRFLVAPGRAFARDDAATSAVVFALALPALIGAVALAVDYSLAAATKTTMQSVADSAAIAAAREFQMARSTSSSVAAVAKSYVTNHLNDVLITTAVDNKALTVQVVLDKDVDLTVGKAIWSGKMHLRASATAKVSASMPLCLLALDGKAPSTVYLEQSASMLATGCMVYSDSTSPAGLEAKNNATLTAGLICSAGGKAKTSSAKVTPDPVLDCPVMDDPLASRSPPATSACSFTDTVINGGTQVLQPGVYCNGLKVTNGATVTLARGVFTIKDGPLVVNNGGILQGTEVGIYLKGQGSNLTFDTQSTISLSAPKDGPLAGILIYDDPTGASALAVPPFALPIPISGTPAPSNGPPREHKILSDNARMLLGTIYMPQGRLIIDANNPIADKSAYTVMVVRRIDLHSGPNLILNSDYGATDVPVPQGVGPFGKVMLTN